MGGVFVRGNVENCILPIFVYVVTLTFELWASMLPKDITISQYIIADKSTCLGMP